jgi:two-component system response regulator NreC
LRTVLSAGAKAYVLKRSVDSELLHAIRAVHNGGSFIDPSLANRLASDLLAARQNRKTRETKRSELLSNREVLVLRMLARGYTNKEIAGEILVSVKSVETYRARILTKLGLRSRSDLVRYAMQMGLLTTETPDPDGRPAR